MEQRGRILIVDDTPMNVDILRRIFRKEYDLETAATGEECLAKLTAFRPQLVLLDVMMPGIDGYDTCQRIKSGSLGESVQVILVSGKGTTADRLRGYEALADDYVVKPFDSHELLSKVRVHFRLRNRRVESENCAAQAAFARLCSLIRQMSSDIGEHSSLIEQIQSELSASGPESPDAIAEAMVRLADTNKATQERLALAERRLRNQAQEIASHAHEARTDVVTRLPNRRAFEEELARRISEAGRLKEPLCALMIDIDGFKHVNDQYGHPAGDQLLLAIGETLAKSCREMDLAARIGGDEFAVLLPRTIVADAWRIARRIRKAIEDVVVHTANRDLQVTASLGLAEWLPGDDQAILVQRADDALYASKKAGRNCIHWHDGEATRRVENDDAPPCPAVQLDFEPGSAVLSSVTC